MENKILIVDDENSIAELISLNLTLAGYETDIANSAEDAIELILKNR